MLNLRQNPFMALDIVRISSQTCLPSILLNLCHWQIHHFFLISSFQTKLKRIKRILNTQWQRYRINLSSKRWEDMQLKAQSSQHRVLWKFTYRARSRVSRRENLNDAVLHISIEFLSSFSPSTLVIYVSLEFKEERKVLLEVIGPELQSIYDDRQIEVSTASNDAQRHNQKLLFLSTDWICWHAFRNGADSHDNWFRSLRRLWSLEWNTKLLSSFEEHMLHRKSTRWPFRLVRNLKPKHVIYLSNSH